MLIRTALSGMTEKWLDKSVRREANFYFFMQLPGFKCGDNLSQMGLLGVEELNPSTLQESEDIVKHYGSVLLSTLFEEAVHKAAKKRPTFTTQ